MNQVYISGRHLKSVRDLCSEIPGNILHSIVLKIHDGHVVQVDSITDTAIIQGARI